MLRTFLVMAFAAMATIMAPGALAQNVYLTADRLLDTATGRVIQQPAIVIQSGTITAVGQRESVQVPSAARIIELPGATLLPSTGAGRRGKAGELKPGASGDLIGVMGDPLKDAALLESPIFVMRDGEIIKAPAD